MCQSSSTFSTVAGMAMVTSICIYSGGPIIAVSDCGLRRFTSHTDKAFGVTQPALDEGFDRVRMLRPQLLRHIAHLRQQLAIALQIGYAQHLQPGLAGAQ